METPLKFWLALASTCGAVGCLPVATMAPPESQSSVCSPSQLQARLKADGATAGGRFGLAASLLETGQHLSIAGTGHYPMQSVYKLPIAMAVLDRVDRGKLSLGEKIRVDKKYYSSGRSPIRDKYPQGGVDVTLKQLLAAVIVDSDSAACDILLARVTPGGVTAFLRSLGVNGIQVAFSEKEMAESWPVQYKNWATPDSTVKLLALLQEKKVLSDASRAMLLDWMTQSVPGAKRIKGALPPNTPVAHKTGTSATLNGLTAATNDAGIITLPDGRHIAIAVFVSDSHAEEATRELAIASASQEIFACWSWPH